MVEERDKCDNRTRYSKNHYEGKRKDVPARRDDVDTCPEELSSQKPRDNIKACLLSSLKPQSVADRGRSISRERKSSNFERSPLVLCDLAKKNKILSPEMHSKNSKPNSKFIVSTSSEESSSSARTMDDSEVIGTVTVDKPVVPSGRDVGLHAAIEIGQFFRYPENVDVAKKFLRCLPYQWKRSMDIRDDIDIAYYNGTGAEVVEEGFLYYLNQVVYGLSIPLTFFQKGVMNALKSCPGQLNGNVFEMMRVCEALNQKWRDGGIARQFVADDILKYYKFKYVKDRKSGYLFSDSVMPKFFDFESAGRPWCDHLVMVREPNPKGAADTSSLFDIVSREGTELNKLLGALGIRREKRLNSIVEKLQQAHQNRAMVTSGSVYDDIMEIPVCVAGTSSSLVRRPRVKRTVPPYEQTTPVQTPQVGTEGVDADLSIAWKSAAEVLKVAAADHSEYEAEKASLAEQLKEQTALCEQLQKEKVIGDVDLAITGKYSEIIFPEDDAFLVAEQSPTPPVADDMTKEEVVRLRGKMSEMEKALSRARDSINRTLQVHNKLEYEIRLYKSNFDNTFKELFKLQCRYGKIKIDRDEVLRKESDRFALLQKSLKDKRFVDESDKLECQRSLLSLTLYFEAEVQSEGGLKEAYLELLTERGIVPDPARVKFLAQEARNRHSIEAQRCSARGGRQRAKRIIFFNIKKEDRRVQAQLENDLRHAHDELELCKDHNARLEMEKVECNKLLQSSDKRTTLLEARLLNTQKCLQMSQSRLKKYLTPKRGKRVRKTDHERQIDDATAFDGGELERVENEFRSYILSCGKDVDVENDKVENMWFAKGNEGGGASTSKLGAEEFEDEEFKDLCIVVCNLFFWAEDNEQDELVVLSASNKELSTMLQQCLLVVENTTLSNSKQESEMLELQSRLNAVTVELSCKDAEILTANNEAELWKESLKKKKLETMAAN
ncbi:hypothetical protein GIB67_018189 [Kingdonia uniflora]|uniref:Uncharacterized protein n=1 Tax=Kingdonia uniflora TaxID=39325 RepID=A0A7J7NMC1_9MAGN|nr:hypothetical protein GIB67_018189 [Kingdonia uniflora]